MLRYLEIKEGLKRIIAENTPGDKLPDRITLCKMLDTTRTTLDKAMRELEQEGMLISKKGSGTYIAESLDSLGTGDRSNWCVVVPSIKEPIYNSLVSGIEQFAEQHNAQIILCSSDNMPSKQELFVNRLTSAHADGIIMVPVVKMNPPDAYRLYSRLLESHVPLVFCNRAIEGISVPVVTSNDFYGGYIATKHLIEKGYRKIAYIGRIRYKTSTDRCQGYVSALMEAGLPVDRKLIRMPDYDEQPLNCSEEVRNMLNTADFDSIFCFDDHIATIVMDTLRINGKRISDDIGVISYNNNVAICSSSTPPLTSVSYKAEQIGAKAAEIMYDLIAKRHILSRFDYYLFQPEIIVRESCKGPKKPARRPAMLEKMGSFFDKRLDTYDEHQLRSNPYANEYYAMTGDVLPKQAGAKVLDLGCGTGLELEHYFSHNPSAEITGIDLAPGMMQALKDKFPDKKLNLILGSYFDVPLGKGCYDAAVSVMSLHHFTQETKVPLYKKVLDALKPGCSFFIMDYYSSTDEKEAERFRNLKHLKEEQGIADNEFYHYDTPLTLEHETDALKSAGFVNVIVRGMWESCALIEANADPNI